MFASVYHLLNVFLLFLITATLYQSVPGALCSHPSSQCLCTICISIPFSQMGSWGSEKLRDMPKEETQHVGVHGSKDVFVHFLLIPCHPAKPSQETYGPGSLPPNKVCELGEVTLGYFPSPASRFLLTQFLGDFWWTISSVPYVTNHHVKVSWNHAKY